MSENKILKLLNRIQDEVIRKGIKSEEEIYEIAVKKLKRNKVCMTFTESIEEYGGTIFIISRCGLRDDQDIESSSSIAMISKQNSVIDTVYSSRMQAFLGLVGIIPFNSRVSNEALLKMFEIAKNLKINKEELENYIKRTFNVQNTKELSMTDVAEIVIWMNTNSIKNAN